MEALKLHLGCGPILLPGFVNLDKQTGWRFEDGLGDYADNSVDGITISHALLYVELGDWPFVFREFFRVLKPGGVVRVTDDDTETPTSLRYIEPWPDAVTRTGPALLRRHLAAAGFQVFDVDMETTHYVDRSLIVALRRTHPAYYFFIEGVKPRQDRISPPSRVSVWAVTMMRDEVDIAAASLRHMIAQDVDGIVVADNLSSDGTNEAIRSVQQEARIPILLIEDPEDGYYQGRKMTHLAAVAAEQGAEWILPFDADELWRGQGQPLAELLRRAEGSVFGIPSFTYVETGYDRPGETPFERMVYRRPNPTTYPKVCYRYDSRLILHQGNDGLCGPDGRLLSFPTLDPAVARIHHFPHRSPEQFIKKMRNGAAAMKAAADLPASYCSHWRAYGRLLDLYGEEALRIIYFSSFFCAEPWRDGLMLDPL